MVSGNGDISAISEWSTQWFKNVSPKGDKKGTNKPFI
jgi:hypothetical protein